MENKGKVREHGITLVALIITIIILLILAGVAITALTQTGIIGYAKKAKDNMKNAQIEENLILGSYENKIDEISGGISGSRDNISESEELKKQKTMSETEHFTGEYYLDNKPIQCILNHYQIIKWKHIIIILVMLTKFGLIILSVLSFGMRVEMSEHYHLLMYMIQSI